MKVNRSISKVSQIYILALGMFSIFRIILFMTGYNSFELNDSSVWTIVQSFIMGVRFDIVIIGYIMLLPTIFLLIMEAFGRYSRLLVGFVYYWVMIFFTMSFVISTIDIPYFNHFFERFSIGAFQWVDSLGIVVSMILQEPKFFLIIIPFVIVELIFYRQLKAIFEEFTQVGNCNYILNIIISTLFLFIMLVGIRGRVEMKSPIRIGTAYFSNNSFLNKLGLNPVFTLLKSYLDDAKKENKAVNLIATDEAIKITQEYLNIESKEYDSPIARTVNTRESTLDKPNVVLIIMESMSASKLARHGNKELLTPFLDSLSDKSIYFDNVYTAGKHTFNGVFSTLFSFPALYRYHPMKEMLAYDGMPGTLKRLGYSTTYFTTHDGQFDNVEGFLKANDIQNVISESSYPSKEVKTALGVPDDYMFRYSIPYINELAKEENPFFVSFMTASDHSPYFIPDYFKPKSKRVKSQIVEYADWSLKQFMDSASQQSWFENTIFVFIADHGAPIDARYDIALNYFHTPLLIHSTTLLPDFRTVQNIGSQIDVYPTIMGLINQDYVNNTLGVDLMQENRPYVIVNDDDKVGVLDSEFFCIMDDNFERLKLYKYRDKDRFDYYQEYKKEADKMSIYAKSQMQVYQDMMLKKQTRLDR